MSRTITRDDVNESTVTADELQKGMYPGFAIKCLACGSERVVLDNSTGYSPESGGWGSLDLVCLDCESEAMIFRNW